MKTRPDSLEQGLARFLRVLLRLTGARAAALSLAPGKASPVAVAVSARGAPALGRWLQELASRSVTRPTLPSRPSFPPGWKGPRRPVVVRATVGPAKRPLGRLLLLAPSGRLQEKRRLRELLREFGVVVERAWQLRERTLRLSVMNEITRLFASARPLEEVYQVFAAAAARLIAFDSLAVTLIERERKECRVVDVTARSVPVAVADTRMPLGGTLVEWVMEHQVSRAVADLAHPSVPSKAREVLLRRGYRSTVLVPLFAGGEVTGTLNLCHRKPRAFDARDVEILEELARPLASAIERRRLLTETRQRSEEMQALNEAGRAVNRSLDLNETIRMILEQAREVLGAESCGLMALDPEKGELSSVGSLDLAQEVLGQIRLRVGEGIAGRAVLERRPLQSADLYNDPRVRFPQLPRESGLRSMLAVPLLVGDRAIGALTVFRKDIHDFSEDEANLLSAFADQAAMALEHARLFSSVRTYSEQLEGMVQERTRALDEQRRFVEVVLETLPLGLYVLDRDLSVVTANRAGGQVLPCRAGPGGSFLSLIPEGERARVGEFLHGVFAARQVRQVEEEISLEGQARTFRLTAAPLEPAGEWGTHVVLLIEDITLQKRLARQMLLTERLTITGRLAAGVAHELNNPLATIAGCAESLRERAKDPALARVLTFQDFPAYLELIEEEAYRCKEITGSLLQFVREPGSRRVPVDLNGLVEKALELLRHQPRFAGAHYTTELDPALPPVEGNEGQIRQVFLGLAANALEAMEGHGSLTVRSWRLPDGDVAVEFEDEGPGIPEEALPRIFDPFFTTKPPGQGTGLGLAIAQGITTDHGGRIEVETRVGRGSAFRVIFPLSPGGASP